MSRADRLSGSAAATPVAVLTGFLGAGKTTLLNALLRRPEMSDAAVIVNEFGEVGIDHLLVDSVDGDLLTLTTGCLCCAARGDLVEALDDLFARRRGGRVGFVRIVIETTGLADPGPILSVLHGGPNRGWGIIEPRVATVVDASRGADPFRSREAVHQLAAADLVVLSKTDLAESRDRDAIAGSLQSIHGIHPGVPVVLAQDADGVAAALMSATAEAASWTRPERPEAHDHHHLADVTSAVLRTGTVEERRLRLFLDLLTVRLGPDLLRLKGRVALSADPGRPIVIDAVGGEVYPGRTLEAWPDEDIGTRLVAIVRGQTPEPVIDLWASIFGPPRIDRPDAAALATGLGAGPGLF